MSRLLSINIYHYRRGGADCVYLDHAALMESLGWENAFFSMHHPSNLPSPWSKYFVDEIQYGHEYTFSEKIVKATQVIYSFEAQRQLKQLIADYRPDIAHMHNIYNHISPSILPVLKKAGIPTVMTAHDLKIVCPNNKMLTPKGICERCKVGKYYQVVLNQCVQNSLAPSAIIAVESYLHRWLDSYRKNLDRIVVPSRFCIEKFVEWGWPRNLFTYIPNYVDAASFEPCFKPGDYFVYFGRLSFEKGVATLIRAAAIAGVPLKLVGTGPAEADLRSLALSLGAHVEFVGYQTGHALYEVVKASRANVLPSEWYENAPISILESFALGKPTVGARIGGIPETVREYETGWQFESGNVEALATCLAAVAKSPDQDVEQLGRNAHQIVKTEFSRDRYVQSMLELYRDLGVVGAPAAIGATL
jgi:glycosyltransferase involved in cell wall biosynthesis